MRNRIKVVWVCHFSNERVRQHIRFRKSLLKRLKAWMKGSALPAWKDMAVWNTNAIKEFEHFNDIDLTVLFPHKGISGKCQIFTLNGVRYVCFRSQDDSVLYHRWSKWTGKTDWSFRSNRKIMASIIKKINPDIVHVIGAENPYYSQAALDVDKTTPCLVSLQTLMSAPGFYENSALSKEAYEQRASIERQVIGRCDYIFSGSPRIQQDVRRFIQPNGVICDLPLAVGVDINTECGEKEYDFVYFAANINKACDVAIEAFALALKMHPGLKLNVSGAYDEPYKMSLDARTQELGISEFVEFTGPKATHEDVLRQIKKSRFALLPLKVDMISGTIREAMACGLPVVTSVTPATPQLNEKRECVLLSEKGDYKAMAEQMVRLVENPDFASKIRDNALVTVEENYSNRMFMEKWRRTYHEILQHRDSGKALSPDIMVR